MKQIKAEIDRVMQENPNLADFAAREAFRPRNCSLVADPIPARSWSHEGRQRAERMRRRRDLRVGIPRVLNAYLYAPLFSAYLQSLGVQPENIVYSDYTSPELYRAGASRGAIDPCFPAKVAISHVHDLLRVKHPKSRSTNFLPMADVLHTSLVKVIGSNACPTVTATPRNGQSRVHQGNDIFDELRISYLDPILNFADRKLFAHQMYQTWQPLLGLSPDENDRAIAEGYRALEHYETGLRRRGRELLDRLEREDRIGIVMLGRPYHHDPGLTHGILEEFQKRGYPIFSQSTLPLDEDVLDRLFGDDVANGAIGHPLEISDVWKNSYSCGTNQLMWAAKFTARHPNLVALQVSSFKCGHDAPIYGALESIIEQSGTPFSASRISTRINLPARSRSGSKRSIISCAGIAKTCSNGGERNAKSRLSLPSTSGNCGCKFRSVGRRGYGRFNFSVQFVTAVIGRFAPVFTNRLSTNFWPPGKTE